MIQWSRPVQTVIRWLILLFSCLVICVLLPQEIKEPFPWQWGYLEGTLGWDMTGFAFSPIHGSGDCRIKNTREAFQIKGAYIMFGMIYPRQGAPYPHLWAADGAGVIDVSCPISRPDCQARRSFAVIDAGTLRILTLSPQDELEQHFIVWGLQYLKGFSVAWGHNNTAKRLERTCQGGK
jgi:hypothetical protein